MTKQKLAARLVYNDLYARSLRPFPPASSVSAGKIPSRNFAEPCGPRTAISTLGEFPRDDLKPTPNKDKPWCRLSVRHQQQATQGISCTIELICERRKRRDTLLTTSLRFPHLVLTVAYQCVTATPIPLKTFQLFTIKASAMNSMSSIPKLAGSGVEISPLIQKVTAAAVALVSEGYLRAAVL
ncbi:MAG: hypothetical protein ACP5VQ_08500 [Phycisphaerae bacterium]